MAAVLTVPISPVTGKIQLSKKVFSSLSQTEQDLWDQSPQSTKEIILTSRKPAASNYHGYDTLSDSEAATLRCNYCFTTARTPSVKDFETRKARYDHICRYPRDTNGLNIYEQEILSVINHECGILRVTIHDYESGYRITENIEPTQQEHERCEQILI